VRLRHTHGTASGNSSNAMKLIGPVLTHGLWGYVDETGTPRIPFRFQALGEFHEGLAWFEHEEKIGYIDTNNKIVIPPTWERRGVLVPPGDFSCGLAPVRVGAYEGFIDSYGVMRIGARFDHCSAFVGGVALVADKEGFCTIDLNGHVLARLEFCGVVETPYEPDLIKVFTLMEDGDTSPAFVDRFGKIISGPFEGLEDIYEYSVDPPCLAAGLHRLKERVGFLDRHGRVQIGFQFTATTGFSEGVAAVATAEYLWGYIDAEGRWVIRPHYTRACRFKGGTAAVSLGRRSEQRWYVIDHQDNVLCDGYFDDVVWESGDGFRIAIRGSSVAVLDPDCKVIYSARRL